jgi:hypothetical protein
VGGSQTTRRIVLDKTRLLALIEDLGQGIKKPKTARERRVHGLFNRLVKLRENGASPRDQYLLNYLVDFINEHPEILLEVIA